MGMERWTPRSYIEDRHAGSDIDIDHFAEQDLGVFLAVENVAEREAISPERARRWLLDRAGLEEVEIAPIDQRDIDVGVFERSRRIEAAESAAENDNLCRKFQLTTDLVEQGSGPAGQSADASVGPLNSNKWTSVA